jgi:hypothetical protein
VHRLLGFVAAAGKVSCRQQQQRLVEWARFHRFFGVTGL